MALTQRLEFRQSQSLVMTPQLMQAIKLLQLSNLDLSAFVEEELERNPLLERASDGPKPPVRRAAPSRRILRSAADYGDECRRRFRRWRWRRRRLRAGQEEWMNRDLGSRAEIEQTLDTGARQCVFRGAGRGRRAHRAGCGADRLYRMGRRRLQRRRLQSRSLRRRRGDARRSSRRAAGGGLHRAGAAHDRPVSDRSRRRGRLPAAPISDRPPSGSARRRRTSRRCSRCCRNSIRPASARAISERVPRDPAARTRSLRSGDAGAGRASRSSGQARHRGFAQTLRRRRRRHHRHDRRNSPARSEARA